ncbi:MAG: YqgE/AlgH family protein [Fibrobacterota bacterium]
MQEKLQSGTLLLYADDAEDDYFAGSAVLVANHDEDGTFGLVVNRPVVIPVSEVFDPLPEVSYRERIFYLGGPVDEESLHVITLDPVVEENLPAEEDDPGYRVSPGVKIGGIWESVEDILESRSSFLFLGYTGWGAGQLQEEIQRGAWHVYNGVDLFELVHECSREGDYSLGYIRRVIKNEK